MAENAELLLKVGLDLAHFRRQLNNVGSQLAGQPLSINIKLDRSKVVSEFRLLDRYIRNKKFYVEVNTNLKTEVDRAVKLTELLKNMPRGGGASRTPGVVEAGFSQAQLRKLKQDIKPLYKAAADAGLIAFDEAIANNVGKIAKELSEVGKSSVTGLLNGLASGDAQVRAAAQNLGQILISTIKATLGIASPSKETEKLGKFAAEGFEKGFVSSIVQSERRMARAIQFAVIGGIRNALSNLPGLGGALVSFERQLAASIQLAVRKAVREGMSAAIVPGAKGGLLGGTGGAATGAAIGGAKALGGGIAGGMAKLTAGGLIGTAANLTRYSIDNSAYQEFVGKLYQEIINSALGSGSQGAIIGALAVGGVAGGIGFAKGAAGSLAVQAVTAIRNRVLAALLAVPTGGLNNIVEVMVRDITSAIFQKTIRQLRAANAQLPKIDWPAIAGSTQRPPIGPSSTGRLLAGAAPLLSIGASRPAAGLLPSVTRQSELTAGLKALMQALSAQSQGAGAGGPAGAIVSMESGFITAMRERFAKAAERYLFGIETQVLDLYDAANAAVRVKIDRAIARLEAQIGARRTPSVFVRDLGAPVQPLLAGGGVPPRRLALPAAGESGGMLGTSTTVTGGGVTPKGGFPSEGPLFMGKQGPANLLSPSYFDNVKRFNAALDISRASFKAFRASQFPLVGGLRELGGEFATATKQVLLYGTAYKGLAFISSLPGQILTAAKSQQQYTNALQTATQGTGTFAKELLYVDNVQRAFGLNLETTRTGFTRLYASMAPANFDSGSIEKLFTGISAATAALQLTPDKAERVIYAFGQMASKGQIMSEELKGQLGDVLPGALAIFAKAAGMSVKEFGKAMEDGVFVGGKFREVFAKVSDELMTRFGTGAQAAGKSLQGLLNTVGGDFQRTLESFAPLANTAAQAILSPLGNALRQLSTSAQIAMGEMERIQGQLSIARQDVSSLKAGGASADQIRAAEQNVAALEARYRALNEALKDPAVAKQVKDLQLLVQELSKAGVFVMNVATTIARMLAPALNFLGTNLTSVIATITAFYIGFQTARLAAMALMGVLLLYRGLSALLGFGAAAQQATALAGAFNVLGVAATRATTQMVGLRLALTALVASTVVGAVVAGIVMIAGAFATMSDKAKDAAQSSRDAAKAAIDAAAAGNVAGAAMSVQTVLAESRKAAFARQALESIYARSTPAQRRGIVPMTISPKESVALQGTALTSGLIKAGVSLGGARQIRVPSGPEMRTLRGQFGSLKGQQAIDLRETKEAARQAEEVNKRLGLNKPMPGPAVSEAPSAEGSTKGAADKAARAAERAAQKRRELNATLEQLREQLRIERQSLETQEAVALARADGNEKLASFLQVQEKYYEIDEKASKLQKDFAAGKIAEAEHTLKQQLLAIERKKVEITEEERLNAVLRERFGITNDVMEVARKARENAFGLNLGGAAGFRTDMNLDPNAKQTKMDEMRQKLDDLIKTENQVYLGAQAIGEAFGTAFKGIASGAMTAQEALAGMMNSIADHFLDMAAQIITQQMTMIIYGTIMKALGLMGGSGGGFGVDFSGAFGAGAGPIPGVGGAFTGGINLFADGGFVTGPTSAIVGEGGEPEYIIPASKMRSAMGRYATGARGSAVIPAGDDTNAGGGTATMAPAAIDVRYTVERINSVDYVTADQFRAGMAQAAQQGATQGEQRTLRRLQQSRATRSRLGMN